MTDASIPSSGQDFVPFANKMRGADLDERLIELFRSYYEQVRQGQTGMIPESEIEPVTSRDVTRRKDLNHGERAIGTKALEQAVIVKLNGGLGTSMGLARAKSLLNVRGNHNFLDITLLQASGCRGRLDYSVPLVLMNSFSTHEDTMQYLEDKGVKPSDRPLTFLQHMYPKILRDTMQPAQWPRDPELEWNPPGHGDLYAALVTSGMLDKLLQSDKRYAFVSNVDNLGAVMDISILGHFVRSGSPFMMEVAVRTKSDTKGGHLARLPDGRLVLREIAQCPEEDLESFQDISRHSYFNTNNIWLDLRRIKDFVDQHGLPRLPLILNPKHLDPRDENSPEVFQVETAMGAAIAAFPGAEVLRVPRERFIPVKKCNDLLAVRSDCYVFTRECEFTVNPERTLDTVVIDLDTEYYKKIDALEARFPFGPPSLVACASLSVTGDVLFERDVACIGEVRVVNSTSGQATVPAETRIQGDLRFD